jgi:hypothetical protein
MSFKVNQEYITIPSVTTTQRNALTAVNGMVVYDTDLNLFYKYENSAWSSFAGGSGSYSRTVVSTNTTAANDTDYTLVASATFTDPTPDEGKGYSVLVRNGTANIGGSTYNTVGQLIWRVYHSGSWATYQLVTQTQLNAKQDSLGFTPENVANKSDSYTASSSTTYATTKAVVDGLATKFITIPFHSNAFNPLDATNYFLGGITNLLAPSTTNTDQDFTIGFAGTVIGCVIQVHGNSVVGSNEYVTLSLRNNTANTTTTIGVFKTNATSTTTLSTAITGVSIAVGASDSICLQINGTWATNPQGLRLTGYLMVRI